MANTNLIRALGEFCEVTVPNSELGTRNSENGAVPRSAFRVPHFDGPVFMPIADSNLTPLRKVSAPRQIGYCFTEWPIGPEAKKNAARYDVLFAGSTWNVQRLAEAGISSEVLHQGIDFDRFTVQPWMPFEIGDLRLPIADSESRKTKFVVFSGGKYEFRKGQDYVAAAMKLFMALHPDVILLAAWHNQWPQSMATMQHSWLLENWEDPLAGLPRERVFLIPPMRNDQTPGLYAQAHIGVFPNRCEAGTNLVMCEFMASGRPVIATCATGQKDVFQPRMDTNGHESGPYLLDNGTYDPAGWFNCNVSDIITYLEDAYKNKQDLERRGLECRRLVERFTWRGCAQRVAESCY